ncbi:hypothetical protein C2S53_020374 [Perilla frutescens var. hirtella]|uniref:Scarecrow-like protein 8 n=1 Tax=Perilla frutescens var. hirtella TaxID=608512 RepID=A0AAD4PCP5_PERFH|nr:hypothetical protein C2S53_020374 [Perilla frutescens var. hirtella]
MSSGFSGGVPDFFTAGRRPTLSSPNMNNSNITAQQQFYVRSPGILPDPAAQIRLPDIIGKRSLDEFQQQQSFVTHQSNQQALGFYLRNVKQRPNYHQAMSPVDFSPVSSTSSIATSLNSRYRLPILQHRHLQPLNISNGNVLSAGTRLPNLALSDSGPVVNSEKNMMNHRLQELEEQLLRDEDDGETISVVTNSEWSETIQNLIGTSQKPISPSPTSSSSSCCSTSASPPLPCPKQASIDAAAAIAEGKPEVAAEILTRLQQVGNASGNSEQRLAGYMVSALKSRLNPSENPPPVSELYGKEHVASTKSLYELSPCFKLGIMAANLAILEAAAEDGYNKIHVLDFEVGQGEQYVHLLHALASKEFSAALKMTAFTDLGTAGEEKLKTVGQGLKELAKKVGVSFNFYIRNLNIAELSRDKLEIQADETLAANFAFKLYRLPDESVTTENLRDELLRRVKGLSPKVMTVVEQEMNTNTAPLVARVRDTYEFYAALFDSLDATVGREKSERVGIEEGLGRKMGNSVACEGRDRVERCEVFGKWRARMSMAGFQPRPMSQLAIDSLRAKLNSGTRGGAGFIVNEESGGICFSWMGRKLTVASAWR